MKIAELRAKRAERVDDLAALVDVMGAADYVEDKANDAKYDAVKAEIADFDKKIERSVEADRLKASVAAQVEVRASVHAEPRVRFSGLKAFKDRADERGTLVRAEDQAFRTGKFLLATLFDSKSAAEWCKQNGIAVTKAQSEAVNSAGGYLVPEEMMGSIIDLREQYGVFRQNAAVIPMSRDTLNWPRRTAGVTAYFVAEGVAATESSAAWDNVNLTAKKMAALVKMSTEIGEDAIINVADWITNEIAYAFASKEDDCGFNGDGTSTYGGITGLTNTGKIGSAGVYTATGHATFDTITATDIESMRALLPYYALPGAKLYCSQYAFALCFERLIASAGGNAIGTLDGEVLYRYLGTPIVISQKLPSTSPTGKIGILYGDLSKASALGERREVTIQQSGHRYIDTDQIGIFGNQRIDINNHDVGDSSNAGPIVALKMG